MDLRLGRGIADGTPTPVVTGVQQCIDIPIPVCKHRQCGGAADAVTCETLTAGNSLDGRSQIVHPCESVGDRFFAIWSRAIEKLRRFSRIKTSTDVTLQQEKSCCTGSAALVFWFFTAILRVLN